MKKIFDFFDDYWPMAGLIIGLGVLIYLCIKL